MIQQQEWGTLGIFALIALIFGIAPIALAFFLRPKKANPQKEESYECGLNAKGSPWVQFNIQYYLFALVFVIFDIEVLYVYPWAINFKQLGSTAVIEMFTFLAILAVGLVYAWKKGGLQWS